MLRPLSILLGTAILTVGGTAGSQETLRRDRTATVQLDVGSRAEFDRALALRASRPRATVEVTCRPPDNSWCAGNFQAACDDQEGGLSTEPDGGITCSFPD